MEDDALYQLALTRIAGIGPVYAKKMVGHFGDAKAVFQAGEKELARAGMTAEISKTLLGFSDWTALESELDQLRTKGIRMLFFTDKDYPRRLLSFSNSPPLLFYKGNADLNAEKIIAVIGTRSPSDYGRQITEQLIGQLAQPGLLLISGLAFGIDACAHAAALKNNIPTVGILGHGLAHLYPHENKGLAKAMLQDGGLLTAFSMNIRPEPYHFPSRNKIVATLCDALLVVETGKKGGSLLTVEEAHNRGKKTFAVPGKLTDHRSAGCNELIRQGAAELLISGEQLQASMGWKWPAGQSGNQALLPFPATETVRSEPELVLLQLLKETESLSFDELTAFSQLETSAVAMNLLNLELQGLINALPGRRYRIN